MSDAGMLDPRALATALSEIESLRRALPPDALATLAHEVVLRVAHNLHGPLPRDLAPTPADIEALCAALLSENAQAAAALIEAARRGGASHDMLCLGYLAVAADRLGRMWDDDSLSFYRVTIAAGRIYAILRSLRQNRPVPTPDLRRSAIFASVPGDDHTLGISMAAGLARDRGWDIELFIGLPHEALMEQLEQRQTVLIGLSAGGVRALPALIRLIVALRISHPGTRILVCGHIGQLDLNLAGVTGADAVAPDFESALALMEQLIASPFQDSAAVAR